MIGAQSHDLVLGSRAPGDKTNLKAYVRALANAGLAVVLVEPMGKAPLDLRSPAAKKQDHEAAQAEAKAAGVVEWARARQPAGVYLATTDTKRLDRYVVAAEKRYGVDTVNLGVEVKRSRLLIVDADTGAEVERFKADMAAHNEWNGNPTVSSPGKYDPTVPVPLDPWVHRNGGHYWFTIPEGVELPEGGTGAFKPAGDNAYTVYWGDRQILIPPSVRAEGEYRWNGGVRPLPEWLYKIITEQVAERKAKAAKRIDSLDSPVDAWAAHTAWADVLEPDGWVNSGRVSNCGCAEWTAPGPHDSAKSATAHDLGCTLDMYDGSNGHAPLHIWTDNPPDGLAAYVRKNNTRTLSKLQYVAWTHHGGDLDAACQALDIPYSTPVDDAFGQGPGTPLFSSDDYEARDRIMAERAAQYEHTADAAQDADEAVVPPFTGEVPESAEVGDYDPELEWWAKHAGPVDKFRNIPPVAYLVDGFLDVNSLSNIIGPPGAGKSFLALDMFASVANGVAWQGHTTKQARVCYVVGEGLSGFNARIHAWENDRGLPLGQSMHLVDEPVQVTDEKRWHMLAWYCLNNNIEVLVLDTLNRITVGVEENSAKDMSRVVDALDKVRTFAGCHVCVVHHTTRGTDHGRGSTALEGAVDTVLLVQPANKGEGFTVETTKQKNHAEADEVAFNLKPVGASAVVVDAQTGVAAMEPLDPLDRPVVPEVDVHDTIRAIVDTIEFMGDTLGLTKAKIVSQVPMSDVSRHTLTTREKERLVLHALDMAVEHGYVEGAPTANGTSSTVFVTGRIAVPND